MNKRIRELQARKAEHVKALQAINTAAAGRDLNDAEEASYNDLKAKIEGCDTQIKREQEVEQLAASSLDIGNAQIHGVSERVEADPKRGFKTFGEFAQAVRVSSNGQIRDQRLMIGAAAPTTYGNEGTGADGGFAVPPEFSTEIFNLSLTEDSLVPMTDNVEIAGNGMVFPKDETTPWGTDGVRAYWQAEASAGTATKPKLGAATLRLHKLMALVPLTEELLSDAPALGSYITPLMARSIRWKTNEAILSGNGNGQPLGALSGGAAVTVSKDSGQSASTLTVGNVTNMVAQLPPGSYSRAVWLITPDALPSLFQMTLGNYPIYLPIANPSAGGIQGSPFGNLLGRPAIVSQHAAAFSSLGDVQLHDLSYYRTITKAGGIQTATSMHLYFDADATAFRATFRIDGQPKLAAAISQAKGSKSLSPFLQLQNR